MEEISPTSTRTAFGPGFLLGQVARNALMSLPGVSLLRKRTYSRELDPAEQVFDHHEAARRLFHSAFTGAGVSLQGAHVVELGAGPVLANGINFIADGAASYTALDRYRLYRNDAIIKQTYAELIGSLSPERQARCAGLLADSRGELFDDRNQVSRRYGGRCPRPVSGRDVRYRHFHQFSGTR